MAGFFDFIGNAATGYNAAMDERDRIQAQRRKEAQDRLAVIQKLGQVAVENNDGAAAAGFANQMPAMLKQGYGIDVPNQKIVGEPVMARGQDRPFIEQQGPSQVPGQKVGVLGAMSPTPYTYDTGERNLNNPRTLDQARKGLMLAAPKAEMDLKTVSPYENLIGVGPDGKTKVLYAAQPKPGDPNADLERLKLQAEITKLLRGPEPKDPLEAQERLMRIRNLGSQIQQRENPAAKPAKAEDPLEYEKKIGGLVSDKHPLTDIEKRTGIEDPNLKIERLQYGNQLRAQYPRQGGGGGNQGQEFIPGVGFRPKAPTPAASFAPIASRGVPAATAKPTLQQMVGDFKSAFGDKAVSSTYRSHEQNAAKGRNYQSWHEVWKAFDATPPITAMPAAIQWGIDRGARVLIEGDHIHYEPSERGAGYVQVKPGAIGAYVNAFQGLDGAPKKAAPKRSKQYQAGAARFGLK